MTNDLPGGPAAPEVHLHSFAHAWGAPSTSRSSTTPESRGGWTRSPRRACATAGCRNGPRRASARPAPALLPARGVLLTERVAGVLLTFADRLTTASRYMPDGDTVMSDSAASCLVTAGPPGRPSLRVLAVATSVQADLVPEERVLKGARTIIKAVREALGRINSGIPEPERGFGWFITGNYSATTRRFLTTAAQTPEEKAYSPPPRHSRPLLLGGPAHHAGGAGGGRPAHPRPARVRRAEAGRTAVGRRHVRNPGDAGRRSGGRRHQRSGHRSDGRRR